ncbi:uncharacterized protein VTP21DRAFT_5084 [Calcarisporiella thermophila]|uniref:uncharacterized protein n=1 Tax=Calcarisporiella thermophila TaxID=911321 RepID=UPI0037427459
MRRLGLLLYLCRLIHGAVMPNPMLDSVGLRRLEVINGHVAAHIINDPSLYAFDKVNSEPNEPGGVKLLPNSLMTLNREPGEAQEWTTEINEPPEVLDRMLPQSELVNVKEVSSPVIVGYYADWTSQKLPPEKIPWDSLTHINYAFSVVKEDNLPHFESDALLQRVVKLAHEKNAKVLMSIGGWTGSAHFSTLAANANTRATFINAALELVKKYNLDGVDIDWEYPGRQGNTCNKFDAQNDVDNFYLLLSELRKAMKKHYNNEKELTLAVRLIPFEKNGKPLTDVSKFATVVDRIMPMAYDIHGGWSRTIGPNAPFKVDPQGDPFSFVTSANAWIEAKMPREKIAMGIPFYGRSLIASEPVSGGSMHVSHKPEIPMGDREDGVWTDPCAGTTGYSGTWQWRLLREQVLESPDTAKSPWVRHWDNTTQTPWLYNTQTNMIITYDDMKSLKIKLDFVRKQRLGGAMIWALHHDNGELISLVAKTLNLRK